MSLSKQVYDSFFPQDCFQQLLHTESFHVFIEKKRVESHIKSGYKKTSGFTYLCICNYLNPYIQRVSEFTSFSILYSTRELSWHIYIDIFFVYCIYNQTHSKTADGWNEAIVVRLWKTLLGPGFQIAVASIKTTVDISDDTYHRVRQYPV